MSRLGVVLFAVLVIQSAVCYYLDNEPYGPDVSSMSVESKRTVVKPNSAKTRVELNTKIKKTSVEEAENCDPPVLQKEVKVSAEIKKTGHNIGGRFKDGVDKEVKKFSKKVSYDAHGNKNVEVKKHKAEIDYDTGSYRKSSSEYKRSESGEGNFDRNNEFDREETRFNQHRSGHNDGIDKRITKFNKKVSIDSRGNKKVDVRKKHTEIDYDTGYRRSSFEHKSRSESEDDDRFSGQNEDVNREESKFSKRVNYNPFNGRKEVNIRKERTSYNNDDSPQNSYGRSFEYNSRQQFNNNHGRGQQNDGVDAEYSRFSKSVSVDEHGHRNVDLKKEHSAYDYDTGNYKKSSFELKKSRGEDYDREQQNNGIDREESKFSKRVNYNPYTGNKEINIRKEKTSYDYDAPQSNYDRSFDYNSQRYNNYGREQRNDGVDAEYSRFSKSVEVDPYGRKSININKEKTSYDYDAPQRNRFDRSLEYNSERSYGRYGQQDDGPDKVVSRFSKRVEVDPYSGRKSIDVKKQRASIDYDEPHKNQFDSYESSRQYNNYDQFNPRRSSRRDFQQAFQQNDHSFGRRFNDNNNYFDRFQRRSRSFY